jgi:NAD(P)-dependent dehydrogenase (short-subunit alcohol dehydrogenase family)
MWSRHSGCQVVPRSPLKISLSGKERSVTFAVRLNGELLAFLHVRRWRQCRRAKVCQNQKTQISEAMNSSSDGGGSMELNLSGKVVLVAGGTGGLGRDVSLAFLREGAKVVVTYRKQEEFTSLESAATSLPAALDRPTLEGHLVDITDESSVSALVAGILSRHGTIDAVVNTIGGYAGGIKLWDLETKVLDAMLNLNLRSGFTLARAVLPAMLKQGHGSFVNVAAKAAFDHGAGAAAYAASKAAAVALMDSLAADTRGTGIRVNSILPSIIDTLPNRKAMPTADFSTWPKPQDIAKVILFLSSDLATTVHGASIPVYGNS